MHHPRHDSWGSIFFLREGLLDTKPSPNIGGVHSRPLSKKRAPGAHHIPIPLGNKSRKTILEPASSTSKHLSLRMPSKKKIEEVSIRDSHLRQFHRKPPAQFGQFAQKSGDKKHSHSLDVLSPSKAEAKALMKKLNLPIFVQDRKGSMDAGLTGCSKNFTPQTTADPAKATTAEDTAGSRGVTERMAEIFQRIEKEEGEPEDVGKLRKEIIDSYRIGLDGPKTTLYYYKILKLLGKGSFGKVYMASQVLTNRVVAIKCLDKRVVKEENRHNKILHELMMFKTLVGHANVIQIYEVFENKKYFFFVMEYASSGDLLQLMKKKNKLSEVTARHIFTQLAHGLEFIHSKGILHRDIKLDNILLQESEGEYRAKICDFGVSRFMSEGEVINEQCGTPAYIAPEIIKKKGYKGFSADLWSLGVMLYAMVMGAMPFKANNMDGLHEKIIKRDCDMQNDLVTPQAKDLIERLLTVDPNKRITLPEVFQHPWMKESSPTTHSHRQPKSDPFVNPEEFVLQKLVRCGFPRASILTSLRKYSLNHAYACYLTLAKDFE